MLKCGYSLASHTHEAAATGKENFRKQQHNLGLRVHSSSNPRLKTPRVLGRGDWVGLTFHRDIVSAGFIQELRPFAVAGVTW